MNLDEKLTDVLTHGAEDLHYEEADALLDDIKHGRVKIHIGKHSHWAKYVVKHEEYLKSLGTNDDIPF